MVHLSLHGYKESSVTPGLFKHDTRDISFTLVVNDFGIKYNGKEHADHLIRILRSKYTAVATDWEGKLYCGITLNWNYREGYVDISMPGYIQRLLAKYKHLKPKKQQHSP